jgi:hypothetical protein
MRKKLKALSRLKKAFLLGAVLLVGLVTLSYIVRPTSAPTAPLPTSAPTSTT